MVTVDMSACHHLQPMSEAVASVDSSSRGSDTDSPDVMEVVYLQATRSTEEVSIVDSEIAESESMMDTTEESGRCHKKNRTDALNI